MTYWLFTNEWFSAWGTGGSFSLQSQVGEGICILEHTDINQPQTLPVLIIEEYSWQRPVEILFHQQSPTQCPVLSGTLQAQRCNTALGNRLSWKRTTWYELRRHTNQQPMSENLLNFCYEIRGVFFPSS